LPTANYERSFPASANAGTFLLPLPTANYERSFPASANAGTFLLPLPTANYERSFPASANAGALLLPLPTANSVQNDGGVFYETAAAFYARCGFEPTAAPGKAADARRALSRRDIGN
jgi:hypothetical protein